MRSGFGCSFRVVLLLIQFYVIYLFERKRKDKERKQSLNYIRVLGQNGKVSESQLSFEYNLSKVLLLVN